MTNFDFKEWADLYQADPEAFDARREAVLQNFIDNANPESRKSLEQTLFRIKMIRQRSKSPLQSAIESSKLMWESFGKLREEVQHLEAQLAPEPLPSNGLRLIDSTKQPAAPHTPVQTEPRDFQVDKARVYDFKASSKRAH